MKKAVKITRIIPSVIIPLVIFFDWSFKRGFEEGFNQKRSQTVSAP